MLECHLMRRYDTNYPFAGLIRFVNNTKQAYRIEYDLHPLQYLDLRIEREGALLATSYYGSLFSAIGAVVTLVIDPGETYTRRVNLLGNLPAEQRLSGTYRISAVYEYDVSILSNVIELCIA